MKKLFIYCIGFFFTFLLASCEKIDEKSITSIKLQKVEDVLKDSDFIKLMNVRNLISSRILMESKKEIEKELQQVKNDFDFENFVKDIGFNSLKEYREITFLQNYYLNNIRKKISSPELLNQANTQYLEKVINNKSLVSQESILAPCWRCDVDYQAQVSYYNAVAHSDQNSCMNFYDSSVQSCPLIYYPDRTFYYQVWTPLDGNSITYQSYFVPAGFYQDQGCLDNASSNYLNCISNAMSNYHANVRSAQANKNYCLLVCSGN